MFCSGQLPSIFFFKYVFKRVFCVQETWWTPSYVPIRKQLVAYLHFMDYIKEKSIFSIIYTRKSESLVSNNVYVKCQYFQSVRNSCFLELSIYIWGITYYTCKITKENRHINGECGLVLLPETRILFLQNGFLQASSSSLWENKAENQTGIWWKLLRFFCS